MTLPASLAAPARLASRAVDALQAMRQRDRLAITAALLTLLLSIEPLLVLPLRDQRIALETLQRTSASEEATARAARQAEHETLDAQWRARQAKAAQALAAFGASGPRAESLRFLLSRTLQGLPVAVLALRALDVEEIEVAPAPEPAPTAVTVATGAEPDPAAAATGRATLFRHRYELRVGGALPTLLAALEALERDTRPLRIERVRVQATADGALEATVVLMTLGPERTWLSL